MKKTNGGYLVKLYLIPIVVCIALMVGGMVAGRMNYVNSGGASSTSTDPTLIVAMAGFVCFWGVLFLVPRITMKKMEKKGQELGRDFSHNYKFTAHNAIFFIDAPGGRMGVLWRYNPSEIQLADLRGLTDVRTNDGKIMGGSSQVRCQFRLDGKKYSIETFRSNHQWSMKSTEILEAISKSDQLCEMLNAAKARALGGR